MTAKPKTIVDFIDDLPESTGFCSDGPCPILIEPGNSKVLVISGENAGGKSFLARVIASRLHRAKPKVEAMLISMHRRIEPGIERAFIFGEDHTSSTGNISARTALTGLSTSRNRDNPHILMYDEPDIPAHFC